MCGTKACTMYIHVHCSSHWVYSFCTACVKLYVIRQRQERGMQNICTIHVHVRPKQKVNITLICRAWYARLRRYVHVHVHVGVVVHHVHVHVHLYPICIVNLFLFVYTCSVHLSFVYSWTASFPGLFPSRACKYYGLERI